MNHYQIFLKQKKIANIYPHKEMHKSTAKALQKKIKQKNPHAF